MRVRSSGEMLNWVLVAVIAVSGAAAVVTVVINISANKAISAEAERSLLIAEMQAAVQVESEAAAGFVAHLPGMRSDDTQDGGGESVHLGAGESTRLVDHPEVSVAKTSFNNATDRLQALAGSSARAADVDAAIVAHIAFVDSLGRLNDEVHVGGDAMSVFHADTQVAQAELVSRVQHLRGTTDSGLTAAVERSERSYTLLIVTLPMAAVGALIAAIWLIRTRKVRLRVEVLEHVISEKERFIGAVSHELRTPMAAIIGFTELLSTRDADLSDEEKSEYLSLILSQGNEVSSIVDDLLVAARAEIGDLAAVAVPVNLSSQARQVVEALDFPGARPRVAESAVLGLGDPGRVRQIIRNLLTNAIRYGGTSIRIDIVNDDRTSTLRVMDNGDPISPDDQDRMFEAYSTLTTAHAVTGSIGLGLTVARQLAQLMGGDLRYEHRKGDNIFSLTIPMAENHRPAETISSDGSSRGELLTPRSTA